MREVWIGGALLALVSCGVIHEKPADEPSLMKAASSSMTPEQAHKVLETSATNWAFGQGIGNTAINLGAVMAFPPYLAVVLGNAALDISGYEPITVSGFLPEEQGKAWSETYDSIASSPGRASAALSGREYRTPEVIKDDMRKLLSEDTAPAPEARVAEPRERRKASAAR